jgi:GNAT superfamily N-acetyltransferase
MGSDSSLQPVRVTAEQVDLVGGLFDAYRQFWILNDLFVADDARRRGVGAALLRTARDHAARTGAARLVLSTAVANAAAQALYEGDGWRRDTAFLHYKYELPEASTGT